MWDKSNKEVGIGVKITDEAFQSPYWGDDSKVLDTILDILKWSFRPRSGESEEARWWGVNKEIKVTITISVDKTELDEAIKEMERLHELQEKVNRPSVTREPIHD